MLARLALPLLLLGASFFYAPASPAAAGDAKPLTIFAAASTKDALEAAAIPYRKATGNEIRLAFAASSALARQIEAGAPADLFVSANPQWIDYLADRGLIVAGSSQVIASNALVLVGPAGAGKIELTAAALSARLGEDRLAIADPDHVPAGIYGKAALDKLGLWPAIADRLAPAQNVRVALAFVARGEAPLGIVYASDAAAEPAVTIVARIPADSHPPIRYVAAALRNGDRERARSFLDFLGTDAAKAALEGAGFNLVN
ncbi:MAG: molybdate ABC transporter substrate-binding protein [Hyphomicrobiales bacterium]|nr:molybdate ABC transporter substrate-binding protein [Hyphomicrobiales bacterium]